MSYRVRGPRFTTTQTQRETLIVGDQVEDTDLWADIIELWGDRGQKVAGGKNYSEDNSLIDAPETPEELE